MSRTFRVWAPFAASVDLVLGDVRRAMQESRGGWFECDADAASGTRYAYSIDGGDPHPDPRSLLQHGQRADRILTTEKRHHV